MLETRQRRWSRFKPAQVKQNRVCSVSVSHWVAGWRVGGRLQGEGRLVDHDVALRGGGPQGVSGWWSHDPATLAATVRQQSQLQTQQRDRRQGETHEIWSKTLSFKLAVSLLDPLPIRSCPVRCELPAPEATSAWSSGPCTQRRSSGCPSALGPEPSPRLWTRWGAEERDKNHVSAFSLVTLYTVFIHSHFVICWSKILLSKSDIQNYNQNIQTTL